MSNSINNGIPFVPENTLDPAAGLNLALNTIDSLLQLAVLTVGDDTPPGSPADGDRHIVGTAPTGDWSGQANKLARYVATGSFWQFSDAYLALNLADSTLYGFIGGVWSILSAGGSSIEWDNLTEPTISAGSLAIELSVPSGFAVTLDQDVTSISFNNIPAGKYVVFAISFIQDATGGWVITWPASVQGTPSQPDPAANAVTVVSFATWDGGATIHVAE